MSKSRGDRLPLTAGDVVRWRRQLLVTATCTIWMGAVGKDGYGRFSLRPERGHERMVTPHQVAAHLAFGPLKAGETIMHDCDVRLCCATMPGHVWTATQGENMRQAVARGRARGPYPGLVDTRGNAGASRAIQQALKESVSRTPDGLAAALEAAIAEGDPLRHVIALFDVPPPSEPQPVRHESHGDVAVSDAGIDPLPLF